MFNCYECDKSFYNQDLTNDPDLVEYPEYISECSICGELICGDCKLYHEDTEHMTQDDIIQEFESSFDICPCCGADLFENLSSTDKRTEFNDFTDYLCKDNRITDWKYHTMDNPY